MITLRTIWQSIKHRIPVCDQQEMEAWIELLRSAPPPLQGKELLHYEKDGQNYCCALGVYCTRFPAFRSVTVLTATEEEQLIYVYDNSSSSLPGPITKKLFPFNSNSTRVQVPSNDRMYMPTVTWLNDVQNYTFQQIAEVLEWAYLGKPRPSFVDTTHKPEVYSYQRFD